MVFSGAAGQGEREPPAGYHAAIVARQMLFALPARQRPAQVPRVLFTTPEIARLGLTEAEARARHGAALSVIRADLAETDRARAEGEAEGFLKLMVCRGRPVGVTIAGPGAAEMIGLWALMAARGLPLSALAATVLPSPTFGELSKRATGAYFPSKLFDNPMIKRVVGMVQRLLP